VIIRRLVLENFGPYFGKHELDLSVTPDHEVVLIYGENMRGKTSIVNAIRWCLYGSTLDRYERPIPQQRFINYDAINVGDYHMAVEITFDHQDSHYELERRIQSSVKPTSDRDLKSSVNLKKDGYLVPGGDITDVVYDILHPDIARFFLFDGEMLAQYEILLGQPTIASQKVRESIEQILGLPALTKGKEDVETLKKDAQRRQTKALDVSKQHAALTAKSQQLEAALEGVKGDLDGLRNVYSKLQEERDQLSDKLQGFGDAEAEIRELDTLEAEIGKLTTEAEEAHAECKKLIAEAWWIPATPRIAARLLELNEAIENQFSLRLRREQLSADITRLAKSVPNRVCEFCGQPLAEAVAQHLEERQKALAAQLTALPPLATDVDTLIAERRSLQAFAREDLSVRLAEAERRSVKATVDQHKRESKADAIRTRLRGHDRAEIKATQLQLENAVRQMLKVESDIATKARDEADLNQQMARLQQEIGRLPGADKRIAVEADVYSALERLLELGIDEYRDRLRLEVEAEATGIFRELTTEPRYEKLEINEQYGLRIVDDLGRTIVDKSAGAEQIVALALIGALNRCATKEGPIVMDTPFGRLDRGHREKILRFLPTLHTQVILLVQSGELEPTEAAAYLDGGLAREYRISRDESPTRSRFDPVRKVQ